MCGCRLGLHTELPPAEHSRPFSFFPRALTTAVQHHLTSPTTMCLNGCGHFCSLRQNICQPFFLLVSEVFVSLWCVSKQLVLLFLVCWQTVMRHCRTMFVDIGCYGDCFGSGAQVINFQLLFFCKRSLFSPIFQCFIIRHTHWFT